MPHYTHSLLLSLVAVGLFGCDPQPLIPLEQKIDQIITAAHQVGKFNGTALVTRKDQTIYERSFGLADREMGVTNAADTRFLAFSILKPMTAVLVFQEMEAGKLHLTNQLKSFFPNLAGRPAGQLTIQQLLTHTSGMEEVISQHLDRRITPRDLEDVRVTSSGSFEYSNSGYVCLGLVLEAVTGRTYETLLREKILEPAGMKDSGLMRSGVAVANLSRGYHIQSGKPEVVDLGVAMEALDGAGSFYTTARDLWRFDRALATEVILPRQIQDLMVSEQVKGRYGYGWFLAEQGGKYFPWHQGNYRGHTAIFVRQTHREEVIVILSNQEEADLLLLRKKILRALKADAPH